MISNCNIDIEYVHKRSGQLQNRKSRANATISASVIQGGYKITIKTALNNDMFICEKPIIYDSFKGQGKVTIKIPDQHCLILIKDALETNVNNIVQLLSGLTPKVLPSTNLKSDENKENISNNIGLNKYLTLHALHTPDKKKNKLISPNKKFLDSPSSTTNNNDYEKMSPGKLKLRSPIKRKIIIGTGTPLKNSIQGTPPKNWNGVLFSPSVENKR